MDGLEQEVPAGTTLAQLILSERAQHKDLVVELNGRFVSPLAYETTVLQPGSRVELILPAFGG